ncbi:MAG: SocA family protein [candidate division Zixibacteria bacterium]|nr:SocA family protein [candidate division Zixibacteria bacterium]
MIRFKFDEEKFVSLLQYFCRQFRDVDKLKAVKLLYLVDRQYLLACGRPILGDTYINMELGPVPSKAYDLLKQVEDNALPGYPVFADTSFRYPVFRTSDDARMDVFSEAEIDCIKDVSKNFGSLSSLDLADRTHEHQAWKGSTRNQPIDYDLFFADEPDAHREAMEVMRLEQEDRDFTDSL